MKKSKKVVGGAWLKHLRTIASSRTAHKSEACRMNLAKARQAKQQKRLGLKPKFVTSSPPGSQE